jgi:ribulose-bisphosphate carboxylase large chain
MLPIPLMGLPALEWLRSFSELPIHGHRAGLAAQMRHPALGVDYTAWSRLARLAGADHLHVSGLGSKFSETDEEVATNIRELLRPLGETVPVLPALSSGQNVHTPGPTWEAVGSTDLLMLAGGGIIGHPGGSAEGVHSLRAAWDAAVADEPLDGLAARDEAVAGALARR